MGEVESYRETEGEKFLKRLRLEKEKGQVRPVELMQLTPVSCLHSRNANRERGREWEGENKVGEML